MRTFSTNPNPCTSSRLRTLLLKLTLLLATRLWSFAYKHAGVFSTKNSNCYLPNIVFAGENFENTENYEKEIRNSDMHLPLEDNYLRQVYLLIYFVLPLKHLSPLLFFFCLVAVFSCLPFPCKHEGLHPVYTLPSHSVVKLFKTVFYMPPPQTFHPPSPKLENAVKDLRLSSFH